MVQANYILKTYQGDIIIGTTFFFLHLTAELNNGITSWQLAHRYLDVWGPEIGSSAYRILLIINLKNSVYFLLHLPLILIWVTDNVVMRWLRFFRRHENSYLYCLPFVYLYSWFIICIYICILLSWSKNPPEKINLLSLPICIRA